MVIHIHTKTGALQRMHLVINVTKSAILRVVVEPKVNREQILNSPRKALGVVKEQSVNWTLMIMMSLVTLKFQNVLILVQNLFGC